MKTPLLLGMTFLLCAANLSANTNPTSLKLTVYEMRVSENTDCSDAVTVFSDPSATAVDFADHAVFGAGSLPKKTCRCMMFHMSDNMIVVPEADVAPGCTAGTTYTQDIFNDSSIDISIAPDGTTITGNLGTDDKPWAYFTDAPDAAAANNCWQATKSSTGGPCVLDALDLQSDTTKELIFDFDGKIGNAVGSCGANSAPTLSIR